jgi:(2Fe-2S) ferredoxin
MPNFSKHILVCGNQRVDGHPRGCCDPTGGGDLQRAFKARLAQSGVQASVRANKSGCLDQCEPGPTVVVYPDGVWYGAVAISDVGEIVESHIVGGRPVKRLRLADGCVNTPQCMHRRSRSS